MALPFVPKFLRPKKVLQEDSGDDPCRAQVAAITETGTIALTVTEHTPLITTAECTVPCTITDVIFHVKEMQDCQGCGSVMLNSVLPEGSTIEVRKGDVLVIKITHHYEHNHTFTKKSHSYHISRCEPPFAVFMLGKDRKTIDDDITPSRRSCYLRIQRGLSVPMGRFDLPEGKHQKWDSKNSALRYYDLVKHKGENRHNPHQLLLGRYIKNNGWSLWCLAGLHHQRYIDSRIPLHLSLNGPVTQEVLPQDGHHRHLGLQQFEKNHA